MKETEESVRWNTDGVRDAAKETVTETSTDGVKSVLENVEDMEELVAVVEAVTVADAEAVSGSIDGVIVNESIFERECECVSEVVLDKLRP